MAKRLRLCTLCHIVGITITFENGNKLRQHVRDRHHETKSTEQTRRTQLRKYRRELLLTQERLRARTRY